MKFKLLILLVLSTFTLSSVTRVSDIPECYISLKKENKLKKSSIIQLGENAERNRELITANGNKKISVADGYRILYTNKKKAAVVNMKVEISDQNNYAADTTVILDNLNYQLANSSGMETRELIQLNFNGYRIYGLSRASIDVANTLGTFVMFPGNNITVYFYFNNLKAEERDFNTLEEYKSDRNGFIAAYTNHLNKCNRK